MESQVCKKLYTPTGAGKVTGYPVFAIRNWCKNGDLPHVKAGKRFYVTIEAINAFIDAGGQQK